MKKSDHNHKACFAIRCHSFGEEERILIESILDYFNLQDIFVVCDETKAQVNIESQYQKISLNWDLIRKLGVFDHPDLGWRCGDYFYYAILSHRPNYNYYWLCEPDVLFNLDSIRSFFSCFESAEDDFLAKGFGKAKQDWAWTSRAKTISDDVYKCFFPLTRLSRRAIIKLANERALLFNKLSATKSNEELQRIWPNDESFVATIIANRGMVAKSFNFYLEDKSMLDNMTFIQLICYSNKMDDKFHNKVLHPVLYAEKYLKKFEKTLSWKINCASFKVWFDNILTSVDEKLYSDLLACTEAVFFSLMKKKFTPLIKENYRYFHEKYSKNKISKNHI